MWYSSQPQLVLPFLVISLIDLHSYVLVLSQPGVRIKCIGLAYMVK